MTESSESAKKEIHRQKCQSTYFNLIEIHSGAQAMAPSYVREFMSTCKCDDIYDMKRHRDDLANWINRTDPMRMKRILDFDSTLKDDAIATDAVIHYRSWHKKQLTSALTLPNWLYYQCVTRWERFVGLLGAGSVLGGAGLKLDQFTLTELRTKKIINAALDPSVASGVTNRSMSDVSSSSESQKLN